MNLLRVDHRRASSIDKLPSLRQLRELSREPIELGFNREVFCFLVTVTQFPDLS